MEKEIEYGMVDLGLPSGLKWSDRNVGAATPEAFGDYFMWGSTEPDTNKPCDWANSLFNYVSSSFDETYLNEHKSEWLDGNVLRPEYDAAHVNMGGSWRMPTSSDMRELIDGTAQKAEELNGVKGVRFTSKANGNSIFMPFTGRRYDSYVIGVGDHGGAWSSSLDAGYVNCSHYLNFVSDGGAGVRISSRCHGFVVRGVCQ